ncbi:MAG: tRNA (uridine(34)/cytosine(34)/5-carboxymethylaminomethyluridine(34)-2'-O)-methyltransferase TrmL [Deltaproteobacteria bacterium]|jgi:tRNA (cytidine/uridine-2'-O-)-methyltransferase|nr:tRNA (uridine(34)/cytosine(34)/5-carboxymethylaminomethyluridine(34)-2'-O)-methyltransferase TrmL [Deltaproteobacteria bacterium]
MEIILFEPEIPPNTGNIARLSAGLGLTLNLIKPLGFSLEDKYLRRAGLDYWPLVTLKIFSDFSSFKENWTGGRLIATSARQGSHFSSYEPFESDGLIFGPETRGLPAWIVQQAEAVYNIPLKPGVRSLNLAATVGFFLGLSYSRLLD